MADDRRRDPAHAVGPVKRTSARRVLTLAFAAAAGGALAAIAAAALLAGGAPEGWWALAIGGGATCLLGCWIGYETSADHFRALDRLRGFVVALGAGSGGAAATPPAGDRETAALRDAILQLANAGADATASHERRMAAILGNLQEAVVVVTERGQVSLLNGAAKALLGADRAAIGSSLFDAITRESLAAAWAAARGTGATATRLLLTDGRAVDAMVSDLGAHAGALIVVSGLAACAPADIEHDLSLHEMLPDAAAPNEATPLDELPIAAIDCETTGLAPSADRVVSVGGVRMHGARLYRAATIDRLVRPDVPVPPRASAVHGLTDAMLESAPGFAEQAADIRKFIGDAVALGHNIGFDLTILAAESRRHAIAWQAPTFSICTLRIAAALDPEEEALDLEAVALRHGLDPLGRHSALGDSLLTAMLWQRLLPRLRERGVVTLREALDFAASAKRVVALQKTAGW